jgi:hypothetical protein
VTDLTGGVEAVARPGRSSTLTLAVAHLALYGLAFLLLTVAEGSHFSRDVHDGGVIFVWWSAFGSPILAVVTVGVALGELGSATAPKRQCYAGLALTLFLVGLSVLTWLSLIR